MSSSSSDSFLGEINPLSTRIQPEFVHVNFLLIELLMKIIHIQCYSQRNGLFLIEKNFLIIIHEAI